MIRSYYLFTKGFEGNNGTLRELNNKNYFVALVEILNKRQWLKA